MPGDALNAAVISFQPVKRPYLYLANWDGPLSSVVFNKLLATTNEHKRSVSRCKNRLLRPFVFTEPSLFRLVADDFLDGSTDI